MFKVDMSEVRRHAQVDDDVLFGMKIASREEFPRTRKQCKGVVNVACVVRRWKTISQLMIDGKETTWDDDRLRKLTIGSCGTGRGPISTVVSAAMPACFNVHATVPLDIQVIYCGKR